MHVHRRGQLARAIKLQGKCTKHEDDKDEHKTIMPARGPTKRLLASPRFAMTAGMEGQAGENNTTARGKVGKSKMWFLEPSDLACNCKAILLILWNVRGVALLTSNSIRLCCAESLQSIIETRQAQNPCPTFGESHHHNVRYTNSQVGRDSISSSKHADIMESGVCNKRPAFGPTKYSLHPTRLMDLTAIQVA